MNLKLKTKKPKIKKPKNQKPKKPKIKLLSQQLSDDKNFFSFTEIEFLHQTNPLVGTVCSTRQNIDLV